MFGLYKVIGIQREKQLGAPNTLKKSRNEELKNT